MREYEILENDSCTRTNKTVVARVMGFQAAIEYADRDPNYTFQQSRPVKSRNPTTGDLEDLESTS
jgi:hypothetical protein